MPAIKTVFVLGAGTGQDIDMPLGPGLMEQIIKRVSNQSNGMSEQAADEWIPRVWDYEATSRQMDRNLYWVACRTLAKGLRLSESIDEFLFAHAENEALQVVGKIAIARCILSAERQCRLFNARSPGINMGGAAKSWLLPFLHILKRRIQRGSEADVFDDLAVVNFNYDRCLEHFLYHGLQDYFDVKPDKAARAMLNLRMLHPYGSVGLLPWQDQFGIEFGREGDINVLPVATKDLRTFNEATDDQTANVVRSLVSSAETLIFLGFHFHEQNIDLLKPSKKARRIYATVFGRSADAQRIIFKNLLQFLRTNMGDPQSAITLIPDDCLTAFKHYDMSWASQLRV
jgi:hypothetical protein